MIVYTDTNSPYPYDEEELQEMYPNTYARIHQHIAAAVENLYPQAVDTRMLDRLADSILSQVELEDLYEEEAIPAMAGGHRGRRGRRRFLPPRDWIKLLLLQQLYGSRYDPYPFPPYWR